MKRALLAILLVTPPTIGEAAPVWKIDPIHSRISISVDHAGFSRSIATLSVSEGWLRWDAGNPQASCVEIIVHTHKLDFGDPGWNHTVHGRQLLNVQHHPTATFRSRKVTQENDDLLIIDGELTLLGITAPLRLEATRNAERRHPMPPYRHTVGFSASGHLSRSTYGASAWQGVVGDSVALRIEVEAQKQRNNWPTYSGQAAHHPSQSILAGCPGAADEASSATKETT